MTSIAQTYRISPRRSSIIGRRRRGRRVADGYSVMLLLALFGFVRRQLRRWDCLQAQRKDLLLESLPALRAFAFLRPREEAPRTL